MGANIFVGNLDPEVDEKLLYDTFAGVSALPVRHCEEGLRLTLGAAAHPGGSLWGCGSLGAAVHPGAAAHRGRPLAQLSASS